MICSLCQYVNDDMKSFSTHVRTAHGLSSEQYTVNVLHKGIRPVCPECQGVTRYVSFSFKKYCKDHAKLSMIEGGAIGGKSPAWNRGLSAETDERVLAQSKNVSGDKNHFYGKKHTQETIDKISQKKTLAASSISERILERGQEFTLLTPLEEYHSRQQQYLLFKCNTCGEEQAKTLQTFERGSRCYKCHPVGKSNWELQVYDFVRSLAPDAVSGDKTVISPKEIDIYIPSARLGIECHGLYWHSEAGRHGDEFNRRGHLDKFRLADQNGIRLLQIFEDEWRDKRSIVEGMIRHRLCKDTHRCKTWSTRVTRLQTQEEQAFFNSNHISGYTPSKVSWGLRDRAGIIVAALSLRTPRHQARYAGQIEIARFATLTNMAVPGGLSKLLKHAEEWCRSSGYGVIMTYVDRRVGKGHGYESVGFVQCSETDVDYWYTDNELRYNRFKFRARNGLTERQVAISAGVSKIWGCGSLVMLKNL